MLPVQLFLLASRVLSLKMCQGSKEVLTFDEHWHEFQYRASTNISAALNSGPPMSSYSSLYWVQSHLTELQYLEESFELLSFVNVFITASRQSSTSWDAGCFLSRSGNCSCIILTASSVLPSPTRWVQRILIASAWTCKKMCSVLYCYLLISFLKWKTWVYKRPVSEIPSGFYQQQWIAKLSSGQRRSSHVQKKFMFQQQTNVKLILGQGHTCMCKEAQFAKKQTDPCRIKHKPWCPAYNLQFQKFSPISCNLLSMIQAHNVVPWAELKPVRMKSGRKDTSKMLSN